MHNILTYFGSFNALDVAKIIEFMVMILAWLLQFIKDFFSALHIEIQLYCMSYKTSKLM
jgi:hypothetical protein